MKQYAEILATGDEIRSGALVDSNSAWIADKLEETGIQVSRHSCVGDDLQQLVSIFHEISRRSDLAVVTGGLGPTSDDLTAQAAAMAVGRQTTLYPEAMAALESFFARRNRTMPASNKKQAMLPAGSVMIENPVGTAPGFSLQINTCLFFFLPGVPGEMKTMCRQSVLPEVRKLLGPGAGAMKTRTLSTFGLTESQAADALEDFEQAFPSIKLGFRALFPEIQIKLYLSADIQTELNELEQQAVSWIKHTIGRNLISDTGTPLQVTIGELLKKRQATVSLAESCTGGLVAHWLTSQAGSSDYFLLSAVTYANRAKHELLGVSWEVLQEQGAVSEAVALEMARGVQRLAASDYSLSITGIAGPSGGSPAKPVGTVCFGLAGPETLMARTKYFPFANRKMNQTMSAAYSLNLLRKLLLSTED